MLYSYIEGITHSSQSLGKDKSYSTVPIKLGVSSLRAQKVKVVGTEKPLSRAPPPPAPSPEGTSSSSPSGSLHCPGWLRLLSVGPVPRPPDLNRHLTYGPDNDAMWLPLAFQPEKLFSNHFQYVQDVSSVSNSMQAGSFSPKKWSRHPRETRASPDYSPGATRCGDQAPYPILHSAARERASSPHLAFTSPFPCECKIFKIIFVTVFMQG